MSWLVVALLKVFIEVWLGAKIMSIMETDKDGIEQTITERLRNEKKLSERVRVYAEASSYNITNMILRKFRLILLLESKTIVHFWERSRNTTGEDIHF